jgi:hypothetical protein
MTPLDEISHWHAALLCGETGAIRVLPAPPAASPANRGIALLPGAFNPLHAGHRRMADVAADILGVAVEFEISIQNVDKPPLAAAEILARLEQFPPHQPVWLTSAPQFTQKAQCFPQATFIVGVDTLARIADARYYDDSAPAVSQAIADIASHGCTFLVFGRADASSFRTLSALSLPRELLDICREVPASQFREDVSSTQLRIARNP